MGKTQGMRVLIVNQHTENFGDDAAGLALIQLLLGANDGVLDRVDVVYNGPQGVPPGAPTVTAPERVRLKEIGALSLGLYFLLPRRLSSLLRSDGLRRLQQLVREADVVLVAPSGANIGVYRDWTFLLRLMLVVREGGTPVFHWNTIGASGSRFFDALSTRVLKKSKIYVREEASARYVKSLGLACEVGYDTAFALARIEARVRDDVLTVVPAELDSWHPAYSDSPVNSLILSSVAAEVARFAMEKSMKIEILPHLRNATERNFNESFRSSLVGSGVPEDRIAVRDDVSSIDDYDRAIATSRIAIGGRYHTVILAAKNRRPYISLSYENKMSEACRYLETPQLEVTLTDRHAVGERLAEALEYAYASGPGIEAHLDAVVRQRLVERIALPLRRTGVLNV